MPFPSGLRFLLKNQVIILGEFLCMLFVAFFLVTFNIFSLPLIFIILFTMDLRMFFLGFILPGTLHYLGLGDCFFFHVRKVFIYYVFKYFLRSRLFLFSFWDPYNASFMYLMLSQRSLRLSSFHVFFFILFHGNNLHHFVFQLTYAFFPLHYSAIDFF